MFFSNINTILNLLNLTFAMIPQECYAKRLNQTTSIRPPFFVLKSNDELDFSLSNFEILHHKKIIFIIKIFGMNITWLKRKLPTECIQDRSFCQLSHRMLQCFVKYLDSSHMANSK